MEAFVTVSRHHLSSAAVPAASAVAAAVAASADADAAAVTCIISKH